MNTQADTIIELVCPAGTPAALQAAVEAGADAVYCGFRDASNARNFPGLNFSEKEMATSIQFAHRMGTKVYVAVNTYPLAGSMQIWRHAVDCAAGLGADALIMADIGLIAYAAARYPRLRRHLSVQASASNPQSINFLAQEYGIERVVLPRVLSVDEIARLNRRVTVETEVFVFGGLCVMAEGRCSLSSYVTGQSPNLNGVCSPACAVSYERRSGTLVSRLNGYTIDEVAAGMPAGYPTLCKGQYVVRGERMHLFEEPTSLNAAPLLPELARAGISAIKLEGRQRGKAYISQVTSGFRRALDAMQTKQAAPPLDLSALTEAHRETTGAYRKAWR